MKNILLTAICILVALPFLSAQNLIERTQTGQKNQSTAYPIGNELAKTIARREKEAIGRLKPNLSQLFKFEQSTTKRTNEQEITLKLHKAAFERLKEQATDRLTLQIPVNTQKSFELELFQVNIHSSDFDIVTSSPIPEKVIPNGLFYHGIIKGDVNSIAAVSVFEKEVHIFLQDKDGFYKIIPTNKTADYVLYQEEKKQGEQKFTCGVNGTHKSRQNRVNLPPSSQPRHSMMGCVPIYIEADHALYVAQGSNATTVTNFINAMMTQATAIYASIGVNITMSQLFIHTTADPYPNTINDKLNPFGEAKQNNYNGRLAHLISGDGGGGLAWLDVLCATWEVGNDGYGPYGVSGLGQPNLAAPDVEDLITLVHELGHNFGSQHTQACAWNGNNTAIDGCVAAEGECPRPNTDCPAGGGTIMSYCSTPDEPLEDCNATTNWHPQVRTLIQANAATATQECLNTSCGGNGNNCMGVDITVTNTSNGNQTASNTIMTNGTVTITGTVTYQAGTSITLTPGFTATSTSTFTAQIAACDALVPNEGEVDVAFRDTPDISNNGFSRNEKIAVPVVFPNPFNQDFSVAYTLPESAMVYLDVFDIHGRRMQDGMKWDRPVAGNYNMKITSSDWMEGMYFIRLQIGNKVWTKRIVKQ